MYNISDYHNFKYVQNNQHKDMCEMCYHYLTPEA